MVNQGKCKAKSFHILFPRLLIEILLPRYPDIPSFHLPSAWLNYVFVNDDRDYLLHCISLGTVVMDFSASTTARPSSMPFSPPSLLLAVKYLNVTLKVFSHFFVNSFAKGFPSIWEFHLRVFIRCQWIAVLSFCICWYFSPRHKLKSNYI